MRHLSFSRSTSKRLQRLTAFLVAVAMVAGFLPLGAVKVFADTSVTFNIKFSNTPDTTNMGVQYAYDVTGEQQQTWVDVDNYTAGEENTYSFTITKEGADNPGITLKLDMGGNSISGVHVASDFEGTGNVYVTDPDNDNIYYYHYEAFSDAESKNCIIIDIDQTNNSGGESDPGNDPGNDPQPQSQKVKLTQNDELDNLTISGEYEVDNCTLTINENLNITSNGNLVLKGSNAALVISEGGTLNPDEGARLTLADGASKPAAITALYNFEGTDTVTLPDNGWFTFQYDGTNWKLTEKQFTSATTNTITNEQVIEGGKSYRVTGCSLTIASGGKLTINPGGNLIIDGNNASLVIEEGGSFVPNEGASLSFDGGAGIANIPEEILLFESDGTTPITAIPSTGMTEFNWNGTKWVKIGNGGEGGENNEFGPTDKYKDYFEVRIEGHGGIIIDDLEDCVFMENDDGTVLKAYADGSLTIPFFVNNEKDSLEEIKLIPAEGEEIKLTGANNFTDATYGVTYDSENNKLTFTKPSTMDKYYGIVLRFTGQIDDDTPVNNKLVIEDDLIVYDCKLTIGENGSIEIKHGGMLALGAGATIEGLTATNLTADAPVKDTNAVSEDNPDGWVTSCFVLFAGAKAPSGITLYEEVYDDKGVKSYEEINSNRVYLGWTEFVYDGERWVKVFEQDYVDITDDTTINGTYNIIGVLRIKDCTVTLNQDLTIQSGCTLILEGDDAAIVNLGKLKYENGAHLAFEDNASVPVGIALYEDDKETPFTGSLKNYERFTYDNGKWFHDNFDAQAFGVYIDDDAILIGATLNYTVQYKVSNDPNAEWEYADYGINNNNNINNATGTVTINNDQKDLKELFFRLPDGWGTPEGYPKVDIKITVTNTDELKLTRAFFGYECLWQVNDDNSITKKAECVTENADGTVTFTLTNIDINDEGRHNFNLSFDSGFDKSTMYGIRLETPDYGANGGVAVSADGKTATFTCVDGNTVTVTNTDKIYIEEVPGTPGIPGDSENPGSPSLTVLWSSTNGFVFDATAAAGYSIEFVADVGEGEPQLRKTISDESITYTASASGLDEVGSFSARLDIRKLSLRFENFVSISPMPNVWTENPENAPDYSLNPATKYVVEYAHGDVEVELIGDNASWTGYVNNANPTELTFETPNQLKLTFKPDNGYVIHPSINDMFLQLDDDNSCIISLSAGYDRLIDPFEAPAESNCYIFNGADSFTDTDKTDNEITLNYVKGGNPAGTAKITLPAGALYTVKKDTSLNAVVIVMANNSSIDVELNPADGYNGTIKNAKGQELGNNNAKIDPGKGCVVNISFIGDSFILGIGGDGVKEPVENAAGDKITIEFTDGKVEITDYVSKLGCEDVTPGESSIVSSYELELEGDSYTITFIPNANKLFGIMKDGKEIFDEDGILEETGIGKGNKISYEAKFGPYPQFKITGAIEYYPTTGVLDYDNGNTVTINGDTKPAQVAEFYETYSNMSFSITTAENYSCFVMLTDGMGNIHEEYVTNGSYTLDKTMLIAAPEGLVENTLEFQFVQLSADELYKIKFDGTTDTGYVSDTYYKVTYTNGYLLIPKASIKSYNSETDVYTINQEVSKLDLEFKPADGYTPGLIEYGDEYAQNTNEVIGEWTKECELSYDAANNKYTYSMSIDPRHNGIDQFRVTFTPTMFLQSTVTYTYTGATAAYIAIGGNSIGDGVATNKLVEYKTPLSPAAPENSQQYVKYIDGVPCVQMQLAITFTTYMTELKVNGVDYSDQLPNTYTKLLEAFASQHTSITVWVPVSDSYVISTKTVNAVFDKDPDKTQLAVGNFLWFYDDSHKDNDDYVKNAFLEIVQVEYNGTVYTADDIVHGSGIDWDVIVKDGEIVGGQAVLPAGSYVTMRLIPDAGTQLVSLGLNGAGFTVDQDNMYTYSFYVGPGNFHLKADFEPVQDAVVPSSDAVAGGSITLGDGIVGNGSAVLYVGDAELSSTDKANFDSLAAGSSMAVSSYLDISLDNVVYQGAAPVMDATTGEYSNVWSNPLGSTDELASPAEVTLELAGNLAATDVSVLHEKHNGTLEVIDPTSCTYNPETDTTSVTFQTTSFSNYAIAYKTTYYDVTFYANGYGTAPAAQTVAYGKTATQPAAPSASGWTFGGWYTDAACTKAYNFDTAVTANITLYAKWTAAATPTPTPVTTPTATPTPAPVSSAQLLVGGGQAHVQDIGDTPVSVDPETGILTIGTTGQSKRLEEILINFENTTGYEGTMMYRVHVQDYGWLPWTEAGNPAGTTGECKRIEAIEIKLTGELAKYYSVEYCVHIQDYGDMQGWVKDGALAGTTGECKRIEQIKVRVVPKGTGDTMSVKYRVHIQDIGWENTYATNGAMSGTSGQSKRLEGIEIFLTGTQYSGGIQYKTHIQDIGWESSWAENGEMSGTQGQSKRLEAISIQLTGEVAEYYDIYYRVHAQDIGWLAWAKNGEYAGTAGRSARLEGIQIVLVPKGSPAPGATYQGITAVTTAAFVEGF